MCSTRATWQSSTATSCLGSAVEKYGLGARTAQPSCRAFLCRACYRAIHSYIHFRRSNKGPLRCLLSTHAGKNSLLSLKLLLAQRTCSQVPRGHFCSRRRGNSHSLQMTSPHGAASPRATKATQSWAAVKHRPELNSHTFVCLLFQRTIYT